MNMRFGRTVFDPIVEGGTLPMSAGSATAARETNATAAAASHRAAAFKDAWKKDFMVIPRARPDQKWTMVSV
jgi:hypothetical protein